MTDTADNLHALAVDMPARAPELLRWLLPEPLTLGRLVEQREAVMRWDASDPESWRHHCALRTTLYDLQAAASVGAITLLGGAFTLAGDWRPAVELYDRIARRGAGDRQPPC